MIVVRINAPIMGTLALHAPDCWQDVDAASDGISLSSADDDGCTSLRLRLTPDQEDALARWLADHAARRRAALMANELPPLLRLLGVA